MNKEYTYEELEWAMDMADYCLEQAKYANRVGCPEIAVQYESDARAFIRKWDEITSW